MFISNTCERYGVEEVNGSVLYATQSESPPSNLHKTDLGIQFRIPPVWVCSPKQLLFRIPAIQRSMLIRL